MSSNQNPSWFTQLGGDRLRAVITDFYARVFDDVMIGFLFAGKDRQHLIDREYELAARMLGATDIAYTGRPMRTAHAHSPIMGGHFERRMQLMREVMRDHAIDPEIQAIWLAHQDSLRGLITRYRGSECKDSSVADHAPRLAVAPPAADPDRKILLGRRGPK
jgi:hemoglobin